MSEPPFERFLSTPAAIEQATRHLDTPALARPQLDALRAAQPTEARAAS